MACYIFNNKRYSEKELISYLQENPHLINTASQPIIEKLKSTGLATKVFQLTSEEIDQKLKELGVSEDVRKQVSAWHGSPHYFDNLLTKGLIQEVEC